MLSYLSSLFKGSVNIKGSVNKIEQHPQKGREENPPYQAFTSNANSRQQASSSKKQSTACSIDDQRLPNNYEYTGTSSSSRSSRRSSISSEKLSEHAASPKSDNRLYTDLSRKSVEGMLFDPLSGLSNVFAGRGYDTERINTVVDSVPENCLSITIKNMEVLALYGKKLEEGGLNKNDQLRFLEDRDRMGGEFLDRLNTLPFTQDEISYICKHHYEIGLGIEKSIDPFLNKLKENATLLKKIPEKTIFSIGRSKNYDDNLSSFCKILQEPIIDWFLKKDPSALTDIAVEEKAASHWDTLGVFGDLILHKENKGHIKPSSIASALKYNHERKLLQALLERASPEIPRFRVREFELELQKDKYTSKLDTPSA